MLAFAVIFAGAAPADAQVFKPRGGSKAKAGGGAKKATPKARGGGTAKRSTAKAGKKKGGSKAKADADKDNVAEEDDYVEIIDDDE